MCIYAESVINLMKRKYKEGVAAFSDLVNSSPAELREYIGNCYAFRGYGYSAQGKHNTAIADFWNTKQMGPLNKASEFN